AQAAATARLGGVLSMVGFNYRRVPALELARQLIAEGRLGEIRHGRAQYLQDWLVDPSFPLTWRLRSEEAGSGALGDLGAHIVDLTSHLLADKVTSVSSLLKTFVEHRPLSGNGPASRQGSPPGAVTGDAASLFLARFGGGAIASF